MYRIYWKHIFEHPDKQKPTKIIQYGTHTPSNRILLVAESLTFKPTLEYLSILSILRTELPELIQFKPKTFPVPVRKILENCYSHKGEVEILIFNRSAETKLCPKPKDFGKYEWVKIPICVSDLHHLGPIIKNFDFSYANFRPRKPFFFYHNWDRKYGSDRGVRIPGLTWIRTAAFFVSP